MPFLVLEVVFSFLLDLLHVLTRADHDKDLESCTCASSCGSTSARRGSRGPRAGRKCSWPAWPPSCPTSRGSACSHARHLAALASRNRQAEVDIRQPPETRAAAHLRRMYPTRPAPGAREPPLGRRQAP